jgi:subtilisin family serine protease
MATQGPYVPPPPPVIDELPDSEPMESYDGRHRFVVRIPGSTTIDGTRVLRAGSSSESSRPNSAETSGQADSELAPSGPFRSRPAAGSALTTAADGAGGDTFWGLDVDDLDQVPPGVELVMVGGQPGYFDSNGRFIPLGTPAPDDASTGQGSTGTGSPVGGQGGVAEGSDASAGDGQDGSSSSPGPVMPVAEGDLPSFDLDAVLNGQEQDGSDGVDQRLAKALLSVDGVVSAVPIGDGSVAVVTSQPDTLHGLNLEVVADVSMGLAEAPPDKYQTYQWYLENDGTNLDPLDSPPAQTADADIDSDAASAGSQGRGVVVAVIDTGVDFSHPDLEGQAWQNESEICGNGLDDDQNGFVDDCVGWDFGSDDNMPFVAGQNSHGTHVAGIIAAKQDNVVGIRGVAPDVSIMDLNVSGPGGMPISAVARAVRYAVDNGADVINMSLGTDPGTPEYAVLPLIEAVRYADQHGVVVVVAAGNSGVNIDYAAVYPASIDSPNLVTVGASAPDETKASFSNFGNAVDLFAPGVLVLSTVPGGEWQFMNGTSMASPVVAGVAATLVASNPELSPLEIRDQLVGSGDPNAAYASVANPVRVNHARALGLVPDEDEVDVLIGGLATATPDEVVAEITFNEPAPLVDEPYHWEATLIAVAQDGSGYGIVDHPVEKDWNAERTDDRGAVELGASGTWSVRLETSLPEGVYALMVEAVLDEDPSVRLGDSFIVGFDVTDPAASTTTTEAPGTPAPSTTQPAAVSTTVPSSSPTTSGPSSTVSNTPSTVASTQPSSTNPGTGSTVPVETTVVTSPPEDTTNTTSSTSTSAPTTSSRPPANDDAPTTTTPAPTTSTSGGSTTPTTGPVATSTTPTTTTPSTSLAPTSTTAPSTTAPTTAPPTTAPSDGGTGGGDSGDGGAGFRIDSISPIQGYTGTVEYVSLSGSFPNLVNVWFGDQPSDLVFFSQTWIVVAAPVRAEPGAVDVTLRSRVYGTVALERSAFTFLDPESGAGGDTPGATSTTSTSVPPGVTSTVTTTTPPTVPPTSSSTPGTDPQATSTTAADDPDQPASSTTAPENSTSSTVGSTSSTTVAPTSTTVPEPVTSRSARYEPVGDPVTFGNGLSAVRLQGLADLDKLVRCTSSPCQAGNR